MSKLKAYIAGPMTGREHYNVANFFRVQREWEARGYDASTPFEANSRVWIRHYGVGFNPYIDKCDYGDPILTEMLIEDLKQLFESDVVIVLDGWMKSKGAQLEVAVAAALGKQVIDETGTQEFINTKGLKTEATLESESILEEAQRLVHGDRGADYGHPIDDYTRTGRMWGAILGIPDIDPRVCCLMMAAMKTSREVNKHKRDNLTDLAGYTECASMVADEQARRAEPGSAKAAA